MRPVYETSKDRERESALAGKIAVMWDIQAKPNPKMYAIDYSFINDAGEVEGFGEIKTRTHPFGTFPTYMISSHKVASAKALASATGLDVFLIVEWSCGTVGYLSMVDAKPDSIQWGGRKDRGDKQDMEPVNHYEMRQFQIATKEQIRNGEFDGI